MKKFFPILSVLIVVGGLSFYFLKFKGSGSKQDKNNQSDPGKIHFEFEKLPGEIVAQMGSLSLNQSEIDQSAAMRAFRSREKDLLFVLVYKQFVSYNEKPPEAIEFSSGNLSLSPQNLLNQFKIPFKSQVNISFNAFDPSDGIARADGRRVSREDIDFNNVIWASHESEIFRYKLKDIDKKLKGLVIEAEAKKLQILPRQYREKYIFQKIPMEISEKDLLAYMKKYHMEDNSRNRNNAETRLLDMRKRRGIDFILEKYVMDLPIKVALEAPAYRLEAKDELTPRFGGKKLTVTFFGDTHQAAGAYLLESVIELVKKYPSSNFYFRPVFPEKDEIQTIISKGHACGWKLAPDKFWKFFQATLGPFNGDPKKKLMAEASLAGINDAKLKDCMANPEMNKVLQYHLDYARYLSIEVGPVVYVDGEVFRGKINLDDLEETIQRNLKIPTAGIW